MGFQAAPVGDSRVDGQCLLHLAYIDKILKPDRKAEIAEHGFGNARIAAFVLLMAFHDRRRDIEICSISEFADHRHRRIGLKPKFGTESRLYVAVMFKIAPFMPDRPEMHVARTVIMPGVTERQRPGRRR